MQIEGLTDEIKTHIADTKKIDTEIKEYVYLNGLIDATVATITDWNLIDNNTMQMAVKLNDAKSTILRISIDLKNNEYEITKEDK